MNYPKEYVTENLPDHFLKIIQQSIFRHVKDSAEIHVTKDGTVDATVNLGDIDEYVIEDDQVVAALSVLVKVLMHQKQDEIDDLLEDLEDQKRQSLKEEYEKRRYQESHQPTIRTKN